MNTYITAKKLIVKYQYINPNNQGDRLTFEENFYYFDNNFILVTADNNREDSLEPLEYIYNLYHNAIVVNTIICNNETTKFSFDYLITLEDEYSFLSVENIANLL